MLRKIIDNFRQGFNRNVVLTRYFRKMEYTANRNVSILLSRMRSLLLTDRNKEINALKLETVLTKVWKAFYRRPVELMKSDWTDGQEKKLCLTKRFVYKLNCRLSHSIELLQRNSNEQRLNQRNTGLIKMFSRLTEDFSEKCLLGMLQDHENVRLRTKVVRDLVTVQSAFLSSVIGKWRHYNSS